MVFGEVRVDRLVGAGTYFLSRGPRMTIELSERECPDCESRLQVIYVTELKQVVSGWACPECGFLASKKHGFEGSVPKPTNREYVLRIERPLTSDDVRDPLADVPDEFRARASRDMADDEVWMLLDPSDGTLVDIRAGEEIENSSGGHSE